MDLLRQWLEHNETWQTVHQTVVGVMNRCSALNVRGILRAQIMSNELAEPYPEAALNNLRQAIQEYDSIDDAYIINSLNRSIAVTQDDPGVGIRLAREVQSAITRIRQKDALGTRVILLASLLQLHHSDLSTKHRSGIQDVSNPDISRILSQAIKNMDTELSATDTELLAQYLHVPPAEVRHTLQRYINLATETLFVELDNK